MSACETCGRSFETTCITISSLYSYPFCLRRVPELTYEGIEVANGQDAGLAWE